MCSINKLRLTVPEMSAGELGKIDGLVREIMGA
jgi:hypothetical protein